MHSKRLEKVFVAMQAQTSLQPIEIFIEKNRLKITSLSFGSMYLRFVNENAVYYGCGFFMQSILDQNNIAKVQIVIYDYLSENALSIQKNEK